MRLPMQVLLALQRPPQRRRHRSIRHGPPILQQLRGFSPLAAGYTIGAESAAWTLAAMLVAGATGLWDARWIRIGVACLIASLVILALTSLMAEQRRLQAELGRRGRRDRLLADGLHDW